MNRNHIDVHRTGTKISGANSAALTSFLTDGAFAKLDAVSVQLNAAFGMGKVFLVGSALTKPDYRDVDVRLYLTDAEYDRLGLGMRSLLTNAISCMLIEWTGLPVDFQFTRLSTYEREYSNYRRICLGRSSPLSVLGITAVTRKNTN